MKKKPLILLIVILILAASTWLYLRYRKSRDLEPIIKDRLGNLVKDASRGLYRLEIENLEIDILNSKLVLVKAHLVPDTVLYKKLEEQQLAPNDIFDIYIDKLSLTNIDVAAFTADKEINLKKLFIDAPVIKVWHKKQSYNRSLDSTNTVYQQLSKDIRHIQIDTVLVRDANFTHINKRQDNKEVHFEKVNFIFTGLLVDPSTKYDQSRFLFAEDCRISIKDYKLNTADSLYRLAASRLEIRTRDKVMEVDTIHFKPRLSNEKMYSRIGHQKEIYNLDVDKLYFNNVGWWSLLAEEAFTSDKMTIKGGEIKVFLDRSAPASNRDSRGKFPHQLLKKIPFTINVDTVNVSNLRVAYEEVNPRSDQSGVVYFNGIEGVITNLTNDSAQINANKECRVNVTSNFLGNVPLKATFIFDLANTKNGAFYVEAHMGAGLQLNKLNEMFMPLALVKVNTLEVSSLDAIIRGDNYRSTGTTKLLYKDLNVTALKYTDDKPRKRALLSFIANNFIIKKENPSPGEKAREETATVEHDPNRSFFNLVWKTIFAGAAKTVGYDKAVKQ